MCSLCSPSLTSLGSLRACTGRAPPSGPPCFPQPPGSLSASLLPSAPAPTPSAKLLPEPLTPPRFPHLVPAVPHLQFQSPQLNSCPVPSARPCSLSSFPLGPLSSTLFSQLARARFPQLAPVPSARSRLVPLVRPCLLSLSLSPQLAPVPSARPARSLPAPLLGPFPAP